MPFILDTNGISASSGNATMSAAARPYAKARFGGLFNARNLKIVTSAFAAFKKFTGIPGMTGVGRTETFKQ